MTATREGSEVIFDHIGHSVRVAGPNVLFEVDRIRDHENPGRLQPADIARLARGAATDIDRGFPVEGLRRLVAIGGLAKAAADALEAGR